MNDGPVDSGLTKVVNVVAVDGPAGSGKSSICARVAELTHWTYVNTGALYRAAGILAHEMKIDLNQEVSVQRLVAELEGGLQWQPTTRQLWYRDRDLTPLLEAEQTGALASRVAKNPRIRELILPLQRRLACSDSHDGAVVDGRDIGTVVFPDAVLKVFLTASLEVRARRRLAQMGEGDDETRFSEIRDEMAHRDQRDAGRELAPMKRAADAVLVDTTELSIDQVVDRIVSLMKERELIG